MNLRPSRLLAKVLLGLGTGVVLGGALELGARGVLGPRFVSGSATGLPQASLGEFDPELGWVNKPGANTRVVAAEFAYNARINGRGLRDAEHAYERTPGVARVVLLGDSVAWGWGVDDGASLGDRLEEALGPGVEVVNLAVPGYSTDQQLWLFEREGRRYAPDLVLLCFVMNDVVGNRALQTSGLGKPRYERDGAGEWTVVNRPVQDPGGGRGDRPRLPLLERLHARSGLLQLLRPFDAEARLAAGARPAAVPAEALSEAVLLDRVKQLDKHQERIRALCGELRDPAGVHAMLLGRLKEACDAAGAPLVVMPVPHHHDHYLYNPAVPLPAELAQPTAAPFRTALTEALVELGADLGFPVISVDGAMLAAARRRELLQVADGHLNERGNRVVAEGAARALAPLLGAPGR